MSDLITPGQMRELAQVYLDQIEAQAARIAALEGALKQAVELIAIPAQCYQDDQDREKYHFTGGPRYSAGTRIHNKACADLLPVLKQALAGKGA